MTDRMHLIHPLLFSRQSKKTNRDLFLCTIGSAIWKVAGADECLDDNQMMELTENVMHGRDLHLIIK